MEEISKPKIRQGLLWILYQWEKVDTFCALLIVIEHASLNCRVLDNRKVNTMFEIIYEVNQNNLYICFYLL